MPKTPSGMWTTRGCPNPRGPKSLLPIRFLAAAFIFRGLRPNTFGLSAARLGLALFQPLLLQLLTVALLLQRELLGLLPSQLRGLR
jgi:hypothetical protein